MAHILSKEEVGAFLSDINPDEETIKYVEYYCHGGKGGHHFQLSFLLKPGEGTPNRVQCPEHPHKSPKKVSN